jgi:hypothetical protein
MIGIKADTEPHPYAATFFVEFPTGKPDTEIAKPPRLV